MSKVGKLINSLLSWILKYVLIQKGMKKICFNLLLLVVLSGCFQTTAMVGPVFTVASGGSIPQAGFSLATNKAIKDETGMEPLELLSSKIEENKKKIKKNNLNRF